MCAPRNCSLTPASFKDTPVSSILLICLLSPISYYLGSDLMFGRDLLRCKKRVQSSLSLPSFFSVDQIDLLPCILVGRCVCVYVCRQCFGLIPFFHSNLPNHRHSFQAFPSTTVVFSLPDNSVEGSGEGVFLIYWGADNSPSVLSFDPSHFQFLSVS